MKILVVSDTHGQGIRIYKILRLIGKDTDALIHLGDVVDDLAMVREAFPNLPIYDVCGNCDWGSHEPKERLLSFEGAKIFMTHGHRYKVDHSLDRLAYAAEEFGAHFCLYGHTHIPFYGSVGAVTIMNPASLSVPRGGSNASYGILNITDGVIDAKIVDYERIFREDL